MSFYPEWVRGVQIRGSNLAHQLGVPHAKRVDEPGLYAAPRKKSVPDKEGRKKRTMVVRVRFRRPDLELVFEEDVPVNDFPNDYLIAKLALVI